MPRSRTRRGQLGDLDVDDLAEVLLGEPVEDDDVVDPVEELRREGLGERLLDLLACPLLDRLGGDELASRRSRS